VHDPLTRFSDRVRDYVRSRPSYPPAAYDSLRSEFGLKTGQTIADIGSGTGISAQFFLERGHAVLAVEPNTEMRAAAESLLAESQNFTSIDGRAEATTLAAACADWVVAAQAFHWFDIDAARDEFRRILRPAGRVALLWNDRRDDTPFLHDYEALIRRFSIDYERVNHRNVETDGRIERFLGAGVARREFDNEQIFDFDGFQGRALSSSYLPAAGMPGHDELLLELRRVFDRHASGRRVSFGYRTKLFVGGLS
jgi:SAM-dependent methyltransferase